MKTQKSIVRGKTWIASIQGWSWIITILWMTIANIWKPFGLYGLVCMFTPIVIALCGLGKMHCARVCPRGSFIGLFTKKISIGMKKPAFMRTRAFQWVLWGVMMGAFAFLMVWTIPKGVYVLGNTILIFMEAATALALLFGILFTPRAWCTVCPMGFTTGNLRSLLEKQENPSKIPILPLHPFSEDEFGIVHLKGSSNSK